MTTRSPAAKRITIPPTVTVHQLSDITGVSAVDFIKQLMRNGVMATINQVIDFETAATAATDLGFAVIAGQAKADEAKTKQQEADEDPSKLQPKPPVVTILGHVDHGKTTLLDAIRQTNVVSSEAGGITQRIGAYQAEYKGNLITFLDTPGHEAFTAMRARGAQATDIAILVVAADDGIMPQTIEAINHAKAAKVPIIVAINKVDRPDADQDRVMRQLSEHALLPESWGGDVITVPVSATQKTGIDDLLENLLVVAEVQELKANPDRPAKGTVIEARLDKSRGPMATVLVQQGTLRVGDSVVVGATYGRVKALISSDGRRIREATPATPVEVLGLDSLPMAGDNFNVVANVQTARAEVEERLRQQEAERAETHGATLGDLYSKIQFGEVQELPLIVKSDVQGSLDAVKNALDKIASEKTQVRVIHSGASTVSEGDVLLATASKAIIVGFNTRVEPGAKGLAEREGVEIRLYDIIYRLTDDIEQALKGLLQPEEFEIVDGHALVKTIFSMGRRGRIAGCQVSDGVMTRGAKVRVIRDGSMVHTSVVNSLRRFKDNVREVATGFECGLGLEGFVDFKEGDLLETFHIELR
jgi:translation initiation factor IF-2